jgi:hypothetical protein
MANILTPVKRPWDRTLLQYPETRVKNVPRTRNDEYAACIKRIADAVTATAAGLPALFLVNDLNDLNEFPAKRSG